MKTLNEPTAEEIKKKRIYAEWGLTDEEYRMIEEVILGTMFAPHNRKQSSFRIIRHSS